MRCVYRYKSAEELGLDRVRHGAPCPNHGKYPYGDKLYCWLHRPDLKAIVKAQQAVYWLLGGPRAAL